MVRPPPNLGPGRVTEPRQRSGKAGGLERGARTEPAAPAPSSSRTPARHVLSIDKATAPHGSRAPRALRRSKMNPSEIKHTLFSVALAPFFCRSEATVSSCGLGQCGCRRTPPFLRTELSGEKNLGSSPKDAGSRWVVWGREEPGSGGQRARSQMPVWPLVNTQRLKT